MNKDKLREEIAEDEGCKYEIYLDHLGLPTCGIGHLITESDEEHGKPVGTIVEQERWHSRRTGTSQTTIHFRHGSDH